MTSTWTGKAPRQLDEATHRRGAAANRDPRPLLAPQPQRGLVDRLVPPLRPRLRRRQPALQRSPIRLRFVVGFVDRPAAVPVRLRDRSALRAFRRTSGRSCKSGDPLAGIGQYMCGERWLFPKPVRAGDVLWHSETLHSAELRRKLFRWRDRCPRVETPRLGGRGRRSLRATVPRLLACRSRQVTEGREEPPDRAHDGTRMRTSTRIDACYAGQRVRGAPSSDPPAT